MKKMKKIMWFLFASGLFALTGCEDEYETLATDREDCYISRFYVRGTDNLTVLADVQEGTGIDRQNLTITATVKYGTDLTRLKPYCAISPESILEPEAGSPPMGSWVDFTKGPYKYTVISGNRQVRRTYTVTVTAIQ